MPKRKLLLEKIIENNANDTDNNDQSNINQNSFEIDDSDSDAELAKDFAEGKLKPGLYGEVPFKRTNEIINDKESLKQKLSEIKIFNDNWLERLDMFSEPSQISPELIHQHGDLELKINGKGEVLEKELNDNTVQNDFKRELLFYRQAQTTVIETIKRFRNEFGIQNIFRPDDYFAEMLKSDEHMKKVHAKLQAKQTSLEASEKAKRLREMKKYGKKVQQEVQLKRQQEKKELLEKIQKYKKGKLDSLDFLDNDNSDNKFKQNKSANPAGNKKTNTLKMTKKQRYKEAKYGYGGRKKRSKYNSSESAADVSSFSARKHGRPTKKKNHRLGKSRRQKQKNKSK